MVDLSILQHRVASWPRWWRWSLVLLLAALLMGFIALINLHGWGYKLLGAVGVLVTMPALMYSRWLMGLCAGADGTMRAVERRYMREFVSAITAYMLVTLLAFPLVRHTDSVALKVSLSLLPVVPIGFVVRALVRYVLGSDELEQRVHLQALAVAAGVVGMVSVTAGFLAATKVIHIDGVVLLWVLPALLFVYGLTRKWAMRRFRGE